jgi:undecaprenyl-diphosphatase
MVEWITSLDLKMLSWIHGTFSSEFMDYVMPKLSFIGNGGMVWIFAACILLCTKRYRWKGIALLAALGVGYLIGNLALKPIFARVRPIWPYTPPSLLVPSPADYAFPSGHALSSFAAATVLTLTNKKFGWAAVPLACIIALSRLYLYVHFPSDVLAGAVLGALIGWGVYWLGTCLGKKAEARKQK